MKVCGTYQVTGRSYRGHKPGAVFEAVLDPRAEARAIGRGDITRLNVSIPSIREGALTLPDGWLNEEEEEN